MKTGMRETERGTGCRRRIAVAAYEGAEMLDMAGPIEVFYKLNRCLCDQGETESGYDVVLLAEKAGPFASSTGVRLVADGSWHDIGGELDTLIVVGSPDDVLARMLGHREFLAWLGPAGRRARRLVSVCTGAFLLAEAGLLDGRRATTHWMDLDRMRREYPHVVVETDAIYVRDGSVVTSAGVTAGMDLALSLVEEDFGRKMALTVARRLVMYLKRPGGQAQFSTHLRAQMVDCGPLAPLLAWLRDNCHESVSVDELADRAAMSPRNFARVFLRETGMTPAKYLDRLRLERALLLLEESSIPIGSVALQSGFTSAEQLRRAFLRQMGITPVAYRNRF